MQESEMTTKLSPQGRLPNVPHLPDKAGRANKRRRVRRTEGRKATKAQQKVHGQSETICVSSAPSSLVLTACSSKATSTTAEKSIFLVKKMPSVGLTPACPDPPEDYFCACAPAVPSTLTAYPQAPKDVVLIVLPDYKATVANLTTPPQQPPPPSVLEQKFGSALISFKVHANTQVTFCVEVDDGTGKGFVFQDLNPDQIWHLSTRSSQPCHVRFKIFTPAGCSPYSEILKVPDSFKAPEQCGHLRLVDPVGLRWQGPDAHSLQMIWDTPASNCDTLVLQYVVSMQLVCRGVELGLVQMVYVGSNPSCQIAGLSPVSSYTCRVSAVTAWGYGDPATMTFLTQQAPPDQPMPPLIAESEGSSIHLS